MSTKLPDCYSLSQLYEHLNVKQESDLSQQGLVDNLQILCARLTNSSKLRRESNDLEYIQKLSIWISKSILPDGSTTLHDDMTEDESLVSRQGGLSLFHQKAALGLQALSSLRDIETGLIDPATSDLDPQILLSLIAFTNEHDPWATDATIKDAQHLLSKHTHQTRTPEFLVTYLLQSFIRNLFSKSKPSAVTSTGRKAMPTSAPAKKHDIGDLDRASKPWKYDAVYGVTVFGWAVENSSEEIMTQSWNLFIPPMLTLLDDTSTPIRSRGLQILSLFLPKLTSKLLAQTGLGEVFEDAISPTLLYLPSITPLEESVQLLPAAYKALFVLGDVRFSLGEEKAEKGRIKFFDKIMRKGVLMGYLHANEHPPIVEILTSQIATIVAKMGIHSVKYLKDILPILSTVLTDPFGAARPSLLLAAMKALQVTMMNCWPRMSEPVHRMEIIKALVLCWRAVGDDVERQTREKMLSDVRDELKITRRLLVTAVEEEVDIRSDLEPLVNADPGIRVLFGIETAKEGI